MAGSPGQGGAVPPSPDTGLWRLTRTEYNNTIRDLLGDTKQLANALVADPILAGLDNNAELLVGYRLDADKYERIANQVVDSAFAPGATRGKILRWGGCTGNTISSGCARDVVSAFARRAWRRPVQVDEIDRLMTALDVARTQGDGIEAGVQAAFRMILVSPHFLFRIEVDPPGATKIHPLGPYELATRLSYFVWSSTPDDELLATADASGEANLSKPMVFGAQLARLLADPKAEALVGNFAAQWLETRKLADVGLVSPNPKVFKSFNEDLRHAMIGESQSFFRAFLQGGQKLVDLLDADFTFANARLALHYGLPTSVPGPDMRRVPAGGGTHRGGLLTQAGILTATSPPSRTSPVKRGKWVLERLLCLPPPLPPPKTPSLEESTKAKGLTAATVRDQMEAHRQDPRCASCHQVIDPIGFGLENYDGVGAWRDRYPNSGIDARGELPGHIAFDGARQLAQRLKEDPRFLRCLTQTFFSYALGRPVTANGDVAAVETLAADVSGGEGRLRDLLTVVASSQAFQFRGGLR